MSTVRNTSDSWSAAARAASPGRGNTASADAFRPPSAAPRGRARRARATLRACACGRAARRSQVALADLVCAHRMSDPRAGGCGSIGPCMRRWRLEPRSCRDPTISVARVQARDLPRARCARSAASIRTSDAPCVPARRGPAHTAGHPPPAIAHLARRPRARRRGAGSTRARARVGAQLLARADGHRVGAHVGGDHVQRVARRRSPGRGADRP